MHATWKPRFVKIGLTRGLELSLHEDATDEGGSKIYISTQTKDVDHKAEHKGETKDEDEEKQEDTIIQQERKEELRVQEMQPIRWPDWVHDSREPPPKIINPDNVAPFSIRCYTQLMQEWNHIVNRLIKTKKNKIKKNTKKQNKKKKKKRAKTTRENVLLKEDGKEKSYVKDDTTNKDDDDDDNNNNNGGEDDDEDEDEDEDDGNTKTDSIELVLAKMQGLYGHELRNIFCRKTIEYKWQSLLHHMLRTRCHLMLFTFAELRLGMIFAAGCPLILCNVNAHPASFRGSVLECFIDEAQNAFVVRDVPIYAGESLRRLNQTARVGSLFDVPIYDPNAKHQHDISSSSSSSSSVPMVLRQLVSSTHEEVSRINKQPYYEYALIMFPVSMEYAAKRHSLYVILPMNLLCVTVRVTSHYKRSTFTLNYFLRKNDTTYDLQLGCSETVNVRDFPNPDRLARVLYQHYTHQQQFNVSETIATTTTTTTTKKDEEQKEEGDESQKEEEDDEEQTTRLLLAYIYREQPAAAYTLIRSPQKENLGNRWTLYSLEEEEEEEKEGDDKENKKENSSSSEDKEAKEANEQTRKFKTISLLSDMQDMQPCVDQHNLAEFVLSIDNFEKKKKKRAQYVSH